MTNKRSSKMLVFLLLSICTFCTYQAFAQTEQSIRYDPVFEYGTDASGKVDRVTYWGSRIDQIDDPDKWNRVDFARELGWHDCPDLWEVRLNYGETPPQLMLYISTLKQVGSLSIRRESGEDPFNAAALAPIENMYWLNSFFLTNTASIEPGKFKFVKGLKTLEAFHFHGGAIDDSTFQDLLALDSLTSLRVFYVENLSEASIKKLSSKLHLTSMEIGFGSNGDSLITAIAKLNSLEFLKINDFHGGELKELVNLHRLKILQVSGELLEASLNMPELPELEVLALRFFDETKEGGVDLNFLKRFSKLERVILSFSNEQKIGVPFVTDLPVTLKEISISGNVKFDREAEFQLYDVIDKRGILYHGPKTRTIDERER